jgi:hypothetical protein
VLLPFLPILLAQGLGEYLLPLFYHTRSPALLADRAACKGKLKTAELRCANKQ